MGQVFSLEVNSQIHHVEVEQDTPLLFILRNNLGLKGVKLGNLIQCNPFHDFEHANVMMYLANHLTWLRDG